MTHQNTFIPGYNVDQNKISASISNKLEAYKWDGNSKWVLVGAGSENDPNHIIISNSSYKNKFLKVCLFDTDCSSNYMPAYIYTGQKPSSEFYDYNTLSANGNNKQSVIISSAGPVYIQTITTDLPYDTCKEWDAIQWGEFGTIVGSEILQFTEEDRGPKQYTIDTNTYNKISDGKYYVIVVHYAVTTSSTVAYRELMTEIRQK